MSLRIRQYILLAGFDYQFGGVDFRLLADNRRQRIVNANKAKNDLRFITFDVKRGEVETRDVTYVKSKKLEKATTITPFDPVTRSCYIKWPSKKGYRYEFREGMTGVMSIVDVYGAVREIGRSAEHHTLHELSILSHGYEAGPILVNSYENDTHRVYWLGIRSDPIKNPYGRDPDDKDGRVAQDFVAPTMGPDARTEFELAFHRDGCVWLWGCQFTRAVHKLLTKVENSRAYRPTGVGDEETFTLAALTQGEVDLLDYLNIVDYTVPPPPEKIELPFGYLKYIACSVNREFYPQHMADTAKVRTYAALQGTYSDYDKKGTKLGVMHVHSGFERHLTFYKNYLGFTFDPEGRGYGAYEPQKGCTQPARTRPAPPPPARSGESGARDSGRP